MTTRTTYDRALLDQIIARDGATLVGTYEKLNRESIITFKCKCGNQHNKTFRMLVESSGANCLKCTELFRQDKIKKTNLERFGVEYALQSDSIKSKMKATHLERFGVENPGQSETLRAKVKATNLERYGVENPIKSEIIRDKMRATNLKNFGVEYSLQSKDVRDKGKKTSLQLYGTEYPAQSNEIKEKIRDTCVKKYGVKSALQSDDVKEKIRATILERYGVENPLQSEIIRDKMRATNIIKFGVQNPFESELIKAKMRVTNLERLGVEYPQQNSEVFEKAQKNAKGLKDFTMPSGAIRRVQGYEPFALRDLLNAKYEEEQIKTGRKEIPRIPYKAGSAIGTDGQTLREEKNRYYFPDIFIPHENRIIEVKSTWTYKCKTDFVIQKGEAAKIAGYNYECWIYNGKGKRVEEEEENEIVVTNHADEEFYLALLSSIENM